MTHLRIDIAFPYFVTEIRSAYGRLTINFNHHVLQFCRVFGLRLMIVDRRPYLDDPKTPTDSPPAYDTLEEVHLEKPKFSDGSLSSSSSTTVSPTSRSFGVKAKSKPSKNWFKFSSSKVRTSREVLTTVNGLILGLVKEHASNTSASIGILKSCADACAKHNTNFSEVLQRKYIEDHTPLYWLIVKRSPVRHLQLEDNQNPDLLNSFISYASPLKDETIKDIRLACLATSDQKLFQRLRQLPEIGRISSVDQMLLGSSASPDEIEVEDIHANGEMFAAEFVIPEFHKRMVVSKEIVLEFIARRAFHLPS